MTWHYNTERTAAVSDTFMWLNIKTCPWGVKMLMLTFGGTAVIGTYHGQEGYTHWAPLPRQERRHTELLAEHERRMKNLKDMED